MEVSHYVPRHLEKFSLLSGLNSVYSFLWRTIKYRTFRIITFLLSYPADHAKAYCRYWEIEHRIDTAYKRILKDVGEDIKPFYNNLKGKVKHAKNLRRGIFFSQLEHFEKIYSVENNIVEEFGTQLIKAKKKIFEQKIILQKEYLNEVDQYFLQISKDYNNNPSIDHLIVLRQFIELKQRWHHKFDEMINRMSTFTHPKQVYELSGELIKFVDFEKNIITILQKGDPFYLEQTEICDQLKAETLKWYVQECVGTCLEENGKVTLVNEKESPTIFPYLGLSQFIHKNENFFRRRVEAVLMDHLIKMKNFSAWDECCNSLLSRYQNSKFLSQMEFFWKLRKTATYNEKIFQYVTEKGFLDYIKFLAEENILPGKIELIASASQKNLSVRLYSHYFEHSYQDLGSSKKIPDLLFLEDQNGLLQRIVPK